MSRVSWLMLLSFSFTIAVTNSQRVAVAHLSTANVTGTVLFREVDDAVQVSGTITGMPAGLYGFHVHELGDISTCLATEAHFDPHGNNHGGLEHEVRHVGDLGNLQFVSSGSTGVSTFNIVDRVIALRGVNNILGRGLVLHEQEDDLGLGNHETSLTTGNAGARVACAVIGMHAPLEAWNNSSVKVGPSVFLILCMALVRLWK